MAYRLEQEEEGCKLNAVEGRETMQVSPLAIQFSLCYEEWYMPPKRIACEMKSVVEHSGDRSNARW